MESTSKIHVCFVAYEYLPEFSTTKDLLQNFFSLTDVADSLHKLGCTVSAVVRFHTTGRVVRDDVSYHFVSDKFGPSLKFWQIPTKVHALVNSLKADVVHTHNMNKVVQHSHLVDILGTARPLVVQNHAEWPAKRLRIMMQGWVFPRISRFIFCAPGQEQSWLEKRLLVRQQVRFVMEGSTTFEIESRARARARTKMHGSPVFLWVGNLDENKDPLTFLAAFDLFLREYPKARLYMVFRFAKLLDQVKEKIASSKSLGKAVTMLGEQQREDLEALYNSSDFFVLGSHREGSGYSLMESMACGCIPIMTDIPSFRMMTNGGEVGELWKVGDSESALQALLNAVNIPLAEGREKARKRFEQALSNDAIARGLIQIYSEAVASRRRYKS